MFSLWRALITAHANIVLLGFSGIFNEEYYIIPSKDRVWTIPDVTHRMLKALQRSSQSVPKYLALFEASQSKHLEVLAFRQHCFWTGEVNFGSLEGVVRTEAGFINGFARTQPSKALEYLSRRQRALAGSLGLE